MRVEDHVLRVLSYMSAGRMQCAWGGVRRLRLQLSYSASVAEL